MASSRRPAAPQDAPPETAGPAAGSSARSRPLARALASVAHYLPLDVAARRMAECGSRLLVVVRAGLVSGLVTEQDLLDPSRLSEPEVQVGTFASRLEPGIVWLDGPPRPRRDD